MDGLVGPLIEALSRSQAERCDAEEKLQRHLNDGEKVTEEEEKELRQHGYCISHNPDTVQRFRNFRVPQHQGLGQAIQAATPAGGLLLDKFRAYRPGAVGKGYDEIFTIFEKNSTEKRKISETLSGYVRKLVEKRGVENLGWGSPVTVLDLGCGNGEQSLLLVQQLTQQMPQTEWRLIGVDNQIGCIEKCRQQPFPSSQVSTAFDVHDLFDSPPPHLQKQGEFIVVSHLYLQSKNVPSFVEKLKEWRRDNALIVFVNGTQGTDGDELANKHTHFMRGKPSSRMSEDFQSSLEAEGYKVKVVVEECSLNFPPLTSVVKEAILSIQKGDYENLYKEQEDDFRVLKGLMEFYASFPLEALTQEERREYLEALEHTFERNGGNFLKIVNRIVLAYAAESEGVFEDVF